MSGRTIIGLYLKLYFYNKSERCGILAKSTVEAVRKAETEAAEIINSARKEAEKILAEAAQKQRDIIAEKCDGAADNLKQAGADALKKAEEIKSEAEKASAAEADALKAKAAENTDSAVKAAIDLILQ